MWAQQGLKFLCVLFALLSQAIKTIPGPSRIGQYLYKSSFQVRAYLAIALQDTDTNDLTYWISV